MIKLLFVSHGMKKWAFGMNESRYAELGVCLFLILELRTCYKSWSFCRRETWINNGCACTTTDFAFTVSIPTLWEKAPHVMVEDVLFGFHLFVSPG